MPDAPKTYIVNDQPTDEDALDFTPYVETLADIIQTGNTPLTIGVFGTWGSGKTSLMRMIKDGIYNSEYKGLPKDYTVVWFDAWKFEKEEALWRAFLTSILNAMKEKAKKNQKPFDEFEKLQSLLYRGLEFEKLGGVKIDLSKLGGAFAKGAVNLSLSFIPGGSAIKTLTEALQSKAGNSINEASEAITRERTKIYIDKIESIEQFQNQFSDLVEKHIKPNRLVVFVDDLDRCLPEKAIEVLEAIKLFLDVENCVFILGLDREVISRGIEIKYKDLIKLQGSEGQQKFTIEGEQYLEKIIQLPFQIPPIESEDMNDFVQKLSAEWPDKECPRIFSIGLGENPRQIKRTVNAFLMLWKLADRRKKKLENRIKPIRLAKIVTIQTVHSELYNLLLKDNPRYLRELEEYFRKDENYKEESDGQGGIIAPRPEPPSALMPFVSQRGIAAVRRILLAHKEEIPDSNFVGLTPEELRLYFTLTSRAEAPQISPKPENARLVFEPQMVNIPAGTFLMGSTDEQLISSPFSNEQEWLEGETPQHKVELSEYLIGKYLITNREYQEFVKSEGYRPPRYWDGDQFPSGRGDHPVVNISWIDAIAYCEWLSKQTAKHYRLPTEAEWEKAARGPDALIWPWGNEFDSSKANTKEARLKDTTEVGKFSPLGDSVYGCADMIGNVWEWCNDWYDRNEYNKHTNQAAKDPQGPQEGKLRIVRGGSYNRTYSDARVSTRRANDPLSVGEAKGFRVALTPSTTIKI